jgi:hypothetical protein
VTQLTHECTTGDQARHAELSPLAWHGCQRCAPARRLGSAARCGGCGRLPGQVVRPDHTLGVLTQLTALKLCSQNSPAAVLGIFDLAKALAPPPAAVRHRPIPGSRLLIR